ncbi:hypothetical protein HanRHA438_Chr03g0105971 [Helianthus annuus]|nr:hypothetical protein HanRHA438_Chr03g0105971 [Helianthus annuus]
MCVPVTFGFFKITCEAVTSRLLHLLPHVVEKILAGTIRREAFVTRSFLLSA